MVDQADDVAKSNGRIRQVVAWGAEMAGGAASGALGFMLAGPAGAAAAGAGGFAITKAFVAVGQEVCDRFLSPREKARIGAALTFAADTTRRRIEGGDIPRQDEFIDDGTDRPPIEEVTEGILLAAQRAYDEKRVPYLGKLSGNLNFRPDLDVAAATWITRIANDVSYTQLCMLKLSVENTKGLPITGGKVLGGKTKGAQHIAYLSEMFRLFNAGLVNFGESPVWSIIDVDPPAMRPQGFGVHLYDLMELGMIPEVDLVLIRQVLT